MPVVDATPENLEGYGRLVARPQDCAIEIVRWPAAGLGVSRTSWIE